MEFTNYDYNKIHELLDCLVNNYLYYDSENLVIGENISDEPGIKIIFDGYGYNEETDEQDNRDHESYAIFIHKNSLDQEFPEHDQTPWALIHRPKEEICFYAWHDVPNDSWEFVNIDNNDSKMDYSVLMNIIDKYLELYNIDINHE